MASEGKKFHSIGRIILPDSFGIVSNARTEQIAFDVVDMYYPYNALFGRGTLNAFEAVISYSYLCIENASNKWSNHRPWRPN